MSSSASQPSAAPIEWTNPSKPVRFVCSALVEVTRTRLPVPGFTDDDYAYLPQLATRLNGGELSLSDVSWQLGIQLTRERQVASAAIHAFTEAEWARVKDGDDEDAQADVGNDNALLLTCLNLDDPQNPLKLKSEA